MAKYMMHSEALSRSLQEKIINKTSLPIPLNYLITENLCHDCPDEHTELKIKFKPNNQAI